MKIACGHRSRPLPSSPVSVDGIESVGRWLGDKPGQRELARALCAQHVGDRIVDTSPRRVDDRDEHVAAIEGVRVVETLRGGVLPPARGQQHNLVPLCSRGVPPVQSPIDGGRSRPVSSGAAITTSAAWAVNTVSSPD